MIRPSTFARSRPMGILLGSILALAAVATAVTAPASVAAPSACWMGTTGTDVDGGGPDIVLGLPSFDLPGKPDAGAIVVYSNVAAPMSSAPRHPTKVTLLTADDIDGMQAEAHGRFGAAVVVIPDVPVSGDDTCAEILVGSPGATVEGKVRAGRVAMLTGSSAGLGRTSMIIDEGRYPDFSGGAQSGAEFGTAIAAQTYNAIAIGAPGRDLGHAVDAGRIFMFGYQADSPESPITLSHIQQRGGSSGTAETGDRVGEVLEMIGTPWQPILLVGIPHEDVGRARDAGAVGVAVDGSDRMALIDQNSRGMSGAAEAGDRFGAALDHVIKRVDSTRHVTIAIGVPGEDLGTARDAGAVAYASYRHGVTEIGEAPRLRAPDIHTHVGPTGSAVLLAQSSPWLPGAPETGDAFGSSVLLGSFGSDTRRQLMTTSPGEDIGSYRDAGTTSLVRVSVTGSPIATTGELNAASSGVPGAMEAGDRVGAVAASVQLRHPATSDDSVSLLTLITAPGEDVSGRIDAGLAYLGIAPGPGTVQLVPPVLQNGAGLGMVPMTVADCRPLRVDHSTDEPIC